MDVEVTKETRIKVEKSVSLVLKSSVRARREGMTVCGALNEVICEKFLTQSLAVKW